MLEHNPQCHVGQKQNAVHQHKQLTPTDATQANPTRIDGRKKNQGVVMVNE